MSTIKVQRIETFGNFLDNRKKRIMVLFGGAGSGKSVSLAQLFIRRLYEEEDIRMLVIRKTLPALKITAYRLILDLLDKYQLPYHQNKTELFIRYNDSEILFRSLDDREKIKSYEANYIWIEEATELSYEDFMQLLLRMRRLNDNYSNQMYLSFNPVSPFLWTNMQLLSTNRKDMAVHHSSYLDNPFLSPEYVKQLEDLKDQDETMYRIYTLGEHAVLKNLIYTNYTLYSTAPESFDKVIYGLDFGFNHPTGLLQVGFKEGQIYAEEKIYQTHLTNQDVIALLRNYIKGKSLIYADGAEPARIEEIKNAGFNIQPAIKSVMDGIDYVKRQKLQLAASSTNLIKEIQSYKWLEDRNGNPTDHPLKFRDELVDALRYALYTDHLKISLHEPDIVLPRLH